MAGAEVNTWLGSGRAVHNIGARFPLEETAAAHSAVESGTTIGMVVIEIGGNHVAGDA